MDVQKKILFCQYVLNTLCQVNLDLICCHKWDTKMCMYIAFLFVIYKRVEKTNTLAIRSITLRIKYLPFQMLRVKYLPFQLLRVKYLPFQILWAKYFSFQMLKVKYLCSMWTNVSVGIFRGCVTVVLPETPLHVYN